MKLRDFLYQLPKAELHIHIEGSLEPDLMFELAKRNEIALPYNSIEDVEKAYEFNDLQSFLDIYYQSAAVLIKEQDFYDLAMAYFKRCEIDNVKHTEIFFDPQTHTQRGIDMGTVINGLYRACEDAKQNLGISSQLILCFLRHLSEEDGYQCLDQAMPYLDKITAVGLDSSEAGHPPEKFQQLFADCQAAGLLTVAHAGEEGPADYIWQAINLLNVKRIDHGVRACEDETLMEYLKTHQIPLTVCPLSNIKLKVFDKMQDHNLKDLYQQGLLVTINCDDPAYFGGYVGENYLHCARSLDIDAKDMAQIAKNSFTAAFISNEEKQTFYDEIDRLLASYLDA